MLQLFTFDIIAINIVFSIRSLNKVPTYNKGSRRAIYTHVVCPTHSKYLGMNNSGNH